MVPILAKQAVNRKMDFKASKLLGAYEYYYAAGLLFGYMNLTAVDILNSEALKETVRDNSGAVTSASEGILYLYNEFLNCPIPDISAKEDKSVLEDLFRDGISDGENKR